MARSRFQEETRNVQTLDAESQGRECAARIGGSPSSPSLPEVDEPWDLCIPILQPDFFRFPFEDLGLPRGFDLDAADVSSMFL